MPKDYPPRVLLAIIERDVPHQEHAVLLGSGKRLFQRIALSLVPSFLQGKFYPSSARTQRLHPTSYLDGLRGVASFIVCMHHYTEENVGWFSEPYGLYEDGAPSSPLQLPFIRVLYSGRPMVHIFFIISGFVLSYKPIRQIHSQQYSTLTTTLSSSVFRRALRLFLPSFVGLFIMAVAVHYGISASTYAIQARTLHSQITHWWSTCLNLMKESWYWDDNIALPSYNPALWTIPVEFAQSLLLFIVLLGLSRCLIHIRLFLVACIAAFCFYSGRWAAVEFLGGMFIAEVTLIQSGTHPTPTSSPTLLPKFTFEEKPKETQMMSKMKHNALQCFWLANLVSGLFIASWTNEHVDEVWGLQVLAAHTPEPYVDQKIWFCLAAFQIVTACTQVDFLQSLFTTPLAQYLGNISYALYLTHNLCLQVLEPRVGPILMDYIRRDTLGGRHVFWVAGLLLYVPVIVWVSDLFWRAVDIPTVKLARWLETKCLVPKQA